MLGFGSNKEHIHVNDLEGWYRQRAAKFFAEKEQMVRQASEAFFAAQTRVNESLFALEEVATQNAGAPSSMMARMDPSTKAVVDNAMNTFVTQVRFFIENLPDFSPRFGDDFGAVLTKLEQDLLEPEKIITEIYAQQVADVHTAIDALNEAASQIHFTEKDKKFLLAESILLHIKEVQLQQEALKNVDTRILQVNELQKTLEAKKVKQQSEIDTIKSSQRYKDVLALRDNAKGQFDELQAIEKEVKELFLPLKEVPDKLPRFRLLSMKFLQLYKKDPIDALVNDTRFAVVDALTEMRHYLDKDHLKDTELLSKLYGVLDAMKDVNHARLKDLKRSLDKLARLISGSAVGLKRLRIFDEIQAKEKEIVRLNGNLQRCQEKLVEFQQQKSAAGLTALENRVVADIKRLLGVTLVLDHGSA